MNVRREPEYKPAEPKPKPELWSPEFWKAKLGCSNMFKKEQKIMAKCWSRSN